MLRKLARSFVLFALIATAATPLRAQEPPRPQPPPQPADDTAAARDLFREGARAAEAGQWEAARDHFARSLRHKHAAITLYNLGIAQQETGHLIDAIESFRAFLAQPVEPGTQAYVEPVHTVLTQLEARLVEVDLNVRPAGLRGLVLRVDGREVPPAAGPRKMDPGRHEIIALAPGFFEERQTLSVVEGTRATIAIALLPSVPAPPPPRPVLPAALGLGGLALFLGGEIAFGLGAHEAATSSTGPGRTTMLAGNAVAGAGALAAGVALIVLLTRGPARAARVAVAPWSSGSTAGVAAGF